MGYLITDIANSSNWQEIPGFSFQASISSIGKLLPIPEFDIPVQLEKHIIACFASSTNAKPSWYTAGYLIKKVQSGLTVGGNPDASTDIRKVALNRLQIISFPKISDFYTLTFAPVRWAQQVNLNFWYYTGVEADSTELLIDDLEGKISQLELGLQEVLTELRT